MHEIFWCSKQTSILNGYNLHGNIFILRLIFIFLVWEFCNFYICFCHILGLGFSSKMFCYVVWWVYVWIKKSFKILFIFLLIFMIFYDTWSMKNSVKIQIQATRCQHFGSSQLGEKCNIYMHIITNVTL
jgi:hypothetical protein